MKVITEILVFDCVIDFIYILEDQFGQYKVMEPLISKQSKQYSDILNKLKKQFSSLRRMSSGMRVNTNVINFKILLHIFFRKVKDWLIQDLL